MKATQTRREFWAYVSPRGELIPSTIRERSGDAEVALKKTFQKYAYGLAGTVLVRVMVEWGQEQAS